MRSVAVTFDDLPHAEQQFELQDQTELTRRLLRSIVANDIPAVGFVNERNLYTRGSTDKGVAMLRLWLDAGLELGNHTFSHSNFYETPVLKFMQDVLSGETVTSTLLRERGQRLRYFRYPYLNTGPDLATRRMFEEFLAQRGYTVAPVTVDNLETVFAGAFAWGARQGDRAMISKISTAYIEYMKAVFEFYEKLSFDLLGYEIRQSLLLHANSLNATHFQDLVEMLSGRGYVFVSLAQALEDAAYNLPDTYVGPVGISWLQRWALTQGREFRKEPYLPPFMRQFDNPLESGSDFKHEMDQ